MPTEDTTTADLAAQIKQLTDVVTTFANRPEAQPAPAPAVVKEAPLYVIGKPDAGQHSFARDLSAAIKGDSAAHERLDKYIAERFANEEISIADAAGLNPAGFRPELYVGPKPYNRAFPSVVSGGTLTEITPFVFPKFGAVTDGPMVKPHVTNVEPTLSGATWGSQTITPQALSGKTEIVREVIDQSGGQIETMVWNLMLTDAERAAEARLVTMLDALSLPAGQIKAVNGVDKTLANNMDTAILSLTMPGRFTGLVANASLFGDLYTARDADGRRLYSAINPVNADGTALSRQQLNLDGISAVKSFDLAANSYLVDRMSVYQFVSAPQRLEFDIQVKSVYIGFWQYSAEAVTDATGVIRVTHT